MKSVAHIKQGQVEAACRDYIATKKEVERLEAAAKELRGVIEAAARDAGGKLFAGEFVATLSQCERESFDLKAAKEKIDGRVLRPFLSTSSYSRLVVR